MTVKLPVLLTDSVRKEWVDPNGHFNVGYYTVAFDLATDGFFGLLGLAYTDIARTGSSVFVLELHVNFLRELRQDDPFRITGRLLDFDAKRLHGFAYMHHGVDDTLSASAEIMALHVSMVTRRSAPFRDETLERLRRMKAEHDTLPWPPEAGRAIGLKQRKAGAS